MLTDDTRELVQKSRNTCKFTTVQHNKKGSIYMPQNGSTCFLQVCNWPGRRTLVKIRKFEIFGNFLRKNHGQL